MIYNNENISDENLSDNDNTDMDLNNLKLQESSDSDNDNLSEACETVDSCLNELVNQLKQSDYSIIIIADHGNADKMINDDGSAHTAHTVNLVPIIVVDNNVKFINNGILADVATTVLDLMELKKPKEMTGKSLIKKNESV